MKHLIITDEVWLCFKIMDSYEEVYDLIEVLNKEINGEEVNVGEMSDTVYSAFIYFTDKERKSKLILEEQKDK